MLVEVVGVMGVVVVVVVVGTPGLPSSLVMRNTLFSHLGLLLLVT